MRIQQHTKENKINLFLIMHDFSGARTYIDELSAYLSGKIDVSVFHVYLNYSGSKEFNVQNNGRITSLFIPEKVAKEYDQKYYKRAAQLVYSRFQHLKNVVFHANMPEQYLFTKEAKELFLCPVVFTFHFLMSFYTYYDRIAGYGGEKAEQGNVLEKYMLESADHVICVTEFAQRAIMNIRKIPLSKTSVIYNGKKLQDETPGKPENLKVRYGFSPGDRLILYAGQLDPGKGIDSLIRAFLKIADRFPEVKLVIAGTGEYDRYFPLAQDYVGRICFTGRLKKEMLWDFYKFSEIGVISSRYEQCSYVAIEMMQHHLPLIISDVPGLNELVEHDKTGIICKVASDANTPGALEVDEDDLALQIEYLLRNRTTGLKLAKEASFRALERHSLVNMGESTIKVYTQFFTNEVKNLVYNGLHTTKIDYKDVLSREE